MPDDLGRDWMPEETPEDVALREAARQAAATVEPPEPDDRDLPADVPTGDPTEGETE